MRQSVQRIMEQPHTDVLVVGGGINGTATARELALQGLDVVLAEAEDFAHGASGASSHMIHGGIRYLEYGEFRLVREALLERNLLLKHAPHRVRPLPTVIPLRKIFSGLLNAPLRFLLRHHSEGPSERGAVVVKAGLELYDAFSRASQTSGGLGRHRFLIGRRAVRDFMPELRPDTRFLAHYLDAQVHSPERLILDLVSEAEEHGARIANRLAVTDTSAETVHLTDALTGHSFGLRPRIVVNATGNWVDLTNASLRQPTHLMGGTKGAHLVLDHPQLLEACRGGEVFFEHADGRVVLICPLGDVVLVGTTDLPALAGEEPSCSQEEFEYLLGLTREMFPGISIGPEHVVHTFAGVRPLPRSDAASTGAITRDHQIRRRGHALPILSLVGGKFTTFRAVAEQLTDRVLSLLKAERRIGTRDKDIKGSMRGSAQFHRCVALVGLDRTEVLVDRYGAQAPEVAAALVALRDSHGVKDALVPLEHAPELVRGEIQWMVEREHAVTPDDVLLRRTNLGIRGKAGPLVRAEVETLMR